jgi:hypothetical protein
MDMKNGPFFGIVTSLLVLIAVAIWQFTVLTSDGGLGGRRTAAPAEATPLENGQIKPTLSVSPK